jgi:hypothetical protein
VTDELMHIGTSTSGRYPKGSGEDGFQRRSTFLNDVNELKKQGLSDVEIATGFGINTTDLRNIKTYAITERKLAETSEAIKLRDKGWSHVAIGEKMGKNESSIRAMLDPTYKERALVLSNTVNMLKDSVAKDGFIDVGVGTENRIGISRTKIKAALSVARDEGYEVHEVFIKQVGTGKYTIMNVLVAPGVDKKEAINAAMNDRVRLINSRSEDDGLTIEKELPIQSISSDRVMIRYGDQGGSDRDGTIELRRNVPDLSLGKSRYAQVRVSVDGTHFLKGMALYKDDIPDGYDVVYNRPEQSGTSKKDVFKKVKSDPENPFGATIIPAHYFDENGNKKRSALNIVNEEGDWKDWSKNLSSQFLSKQPVALAKKQLNLALEFKKDEFEDLNKLTNPVIKKYLMSGEGGFGDDCDAAAVHLKAAALPRQSTHVILPLPSIKEKEIYAPNFEDGTSVVLIRHPHGGKFEIPELIVNNKNQEAKKSFDRALDAVGIHPKVAAKLSGADFDGDTVIVIPSKNRGIQTSATLKGLKDFNPREPRYKMSEDLPKMTPKQKAMEMGNISNLITDMTIRGADDDEICRAVKHSMVVIDAEKHHLNYKLSAKDNNISELKEKYQGSKKSGASTLVSKASSDYRVPEKKAGVIDPKTGKKLYVDPNTGKKLYTLTGATYLKPTQLKEKLDDGTKVKVWETLSDGTKKKVYVKNPDGTLKTKLVVRTTQSKRMAEEPDAFKISSGTKIETAYAEHANALKELGNKARKIGSEIKPMLYSPSANKIYSKEVLSLKAKLNIAKMNKPLERRAQTLASMSIRAKKSANPDMDDDDLKKVKGQELLKARDRVGARKNRIIIDDNEWTAIQHGAISSNALMEIILNSDLATLKQRAMPRTSNIMSSTKIARAQSMLSSGHTQAEVANALGVSVSTIMQTLG